MAQRPYSSSRGGSQRPGSFSADPYDFSLADEPAESLILGGGAQPGRQSDSRIRLGSAAAAGATGGNPSRRASGGGTVAERMEARLQANRAARQALGSGATRRRTGSAGSVPMHRAAAASASGEDSLDLEESLSMSASGTGTGITSAHSRFARAGRGISPGGSRSPPPTRSAGVYASIKAPSVADISMSDSSLDLSESNAAPAVSPSRRGAAGAMPALHEDESPGTRRRTAHRAAAKQTLSTGGAFWGQPGTPRTNTGDLNSGRAPSPGGISDGSDLSLGSSDGDGTDGSSPVATRRSPTRENVRAMGGGAASSLHDPAFVPRSGGASFVPSLDGHAAVDGVPSITFEAAAAKGLSAAGQDGAEAASAAPSALADDGPGFFENNRDFFTAPIIVSPLGGGARSEDGSEGSMHTAEGGGRATSEPESAPVERSPRASGGEAGAGAPSWASSAGGFGLAPSEAPTAAVTAGTISVQPSQEDPVGALAPGSSRSPRAHSASGDGDASHASGYSSDGFEKPAADSNAPPSPVAAPSSAPALPAPPAPAPAPSHQTPVTLPADAQSNEASPDAASSAPSPPERGADSPEPLPSRPAPGRSSERGGGGSSSAATPTSDAASAPSEPAGPQRSAPQSPQQQPPPAREMHSAMDVAADALVASLQAASIPGVTLAGVQAALAARGAESLYSTDSMATLNRQAYRDRPSAQRRLGGGSGNGVADSVAHWTHMNERFQKLVSAVVGAGQRAVPAGSGPTLPHVQRLQDIPLPGQPLPKSEEDRAATRFSLETPNTRPEPDDGTAVGWLPLEVARLLLEQLNEQERLLAGFQAENERLVAGEQSVRARTQADIGRVAAERDSLAARVHALSGILGVPEDAPLHTLAATAGTRKTADDESAQPAQDSALPAPPPNLRRSVEVHGALRRELAVAKSLQEERDLRVSDYHKFVAHIDGLKEQLEAERKRNFALEAEAKKLAAGAAQEDSKAMQRLRGELEHAKAEHKEELRHLCRKLQWYRDNQELLDADAKRLREQAATIDALRREVDELRGQLKRAKEAALPGSSASGAAARRISELQRALGQAEEALAKRHPDSVASLVRAATSGPGGSAASAVRSAAGEAAAARAAANAEAEDAARRVKAVRQEYERVVAGHERRCERLEAALRSVAAKVPPPPGSARGGRAPVDVEQLIADAMEGGAAAAPARKQASDAASRSAAGDAEHAKELARLQEQLASVQAQAKQLRGKLTAAKADLESARAFYAKKLKTQAEEAEAALRAAKRAGGGAARRGAGGSKAPVSSSSSTVQGRLAARSGPRGPLTKSSSSRSVGGGKKGGASPARGGGTRRTEPPPDAEGGAREEELQQALAAQEAQVAALRAQLARATEAAADAVAPSRTVIDSLEARLKRAEEEAAANAGKATQVDRLQGELRVLSRQNKRLAEAAAKPRSATVEQLEALAAEVAHLQRRNAQREAELSSAGAAVRVRAEAEVARVKRQAEEQLQAKHDELLGMRAEVDALVQALQKSAGPAAIAGTQVMVQ